MSSESQKFNNFQFEFLRYNVNKNQDIDLPEQLFGNAVESIVKNQSDHPGLPKHDTFIRGSFENVLEVKKFQASNYVSNDSNLIILEEASPTNKIEDKLNMTTYDITNMRTKEDSNSVKLTKDNRKQIDFESESIVDVSDGSNYHSDDSQYNPIQNCRYCRKRGHNERRCQLKLNSCSFCLGKHETDDCKQTVGCKKCLKKGHKEKRCPNKQTQGCHMCKKTHISPECRYLTLAPIESDNISFVQFTCFVCGSHTHMSCMKRADADEDIFGKNFQSNFKAFQRNDLMMKNKYFEHAKRYEKNLMFNSIQLKPQSFNKRNFQEERKERK